MKVARETSSTVLNTLGPRPSKWPGIPITEVRAFLEKQGLRYSVALQDECLRRFQRQKSPPPPPCLGGGFLHIRVPVEKGFSLNFFIESGVHFDLLFNGEHNLEQYLVRVPHTGP